MLCPSFSRNSVMPQRFLIMVLKRLNTGSVFGRTFNSLRRIRLIAPSSLSSIYFVYLCAYVLVVTSAANIPVDVLHKSSEESLKNVDFPDHYDSAAGDFKKPAAFFHKFTNVKTFGFLHGFVAAVSVIIVSELGDKTFFIAAILAMRHSRLTVFLGAISALTVMTILSAAMGFATTVIPRALTHYISAALFVIFGLKMLKEGYQMSPDEGQEEYEEVQKTVSKRETETEGIDDVENGAMKISHAKAIKRKLMVFVSRIFLESFTMTFLAEWGDRSQLTTIILAAREDAIGVTIGAVLGHAMCTALAVLGGRIIAQRISVKSVTLIGGVVFLIFAVWALVMGPGS